MNSKEIKLFIKSLIYDLDTIRYLQEYGRIKETVPIVLNILENIKSFRSKVNEGPYKAKDVFGEDFWGSNFIAGVALVDIILKIQEIEQKPRFDQEEELNKIEYLNFIEQISSWVIHNISQLRRIIKSDKQKKIELMMSILFGLILVGIVVFMGVMQIKTKNWGLNATYYEGMNFEKYISTQTQKDLDYYTDKYNSSVRWLGHLIVPKDGEYTFSTVTDDGVRIWIDDGAVIDQWQDNGAITYNNKIFLSKGSHNIRIDYFNHTGSGLLQLSWSVDANALKIISAQYLRVNPDI